MTEWRQTRANKTRALWSTRVSCLSFVSI